MSSASVAPMSLPRTPSGARVTQVRVALSYYWIHKQSGQQLHGHMRHVWTIGIHGEIAALDTFHDAAKFLAFLKLFNGRSS